MNNVKGFIVTEENFSMAVNAAPFNARQRLFKKMGRRVYRTVDIAQGKQPRMPKDVEQYVENFVFTYGGKIENKA